MKLMAKTAENRYQSASGLRHDLECLRGSAQGNFSLAQEDRCDRFYHSRKKLYGREAEVAALLGAFERVAQGNNRTACWLPDFLEWAKPPRSMKSISRLCDSAATLSKGNLSS